MATLVQKYGGTSVATPERIQAVAQRVARARAQGDSVVVIVSAMGDRTDELVALAHAVNSAPSSREMDMLLSTGEMTTAPLLAMALAECGVPAISLTGLQAGITTTQSHRKARIRAVDPSRIVEALERGDVPVVAGFQGVAESGDITTLGRGGSDTSAVALAVALEARLCEIYTDVAGVYTADPRVVSEARRITAITYEEMLEFAAVGAKVMHPRAVEIAEAHDMEISVRSAFVSVDADDQGTLICRSVTGGTHSVEDRQTVRGIACEEDVAKVTIRGVPDQPGIAANLFGPLGEQNINVDVIVQNVAHDGTTDVSFTIAQSDLAEAERVLAAVVQDIGAREIITAGNIAKVSLVGTGVRNSPGVFATAFAALADAGINIEMISTGEIHLTCIIDAAKAKPAVQALHRAFKLDTL